MKFCNCLKYIVLLQFLFFNSYSYSQEQLQTPEEKNDRKKLETILTKKGAVVFQKSYEIGKLSGHFGANVKVQALVAYVIGIEEQQFKGLKFFVEDNHLSHSSILTYEDAQNLSKAMSFLIDASTRTVIDEKENADVFFSVSDFMVGFHLKMRDTTAFIQSGEVTTPGAYFDVQKDLQQLKILVDKGIEWLTPKK